MTLPIFPTEQGAPGDGSLVAIHGGSPATTEVVGGLIQIAQALESYPRPPALGGLMPLPDGDEGESLISAGVTVWLRGSLLLDTLGQPTVDDYADVLARWSALRSKLLASDYELFLYYHPDAPTAYRKYKSMNTVFLRSYWNNPVTLSFTVAGVSIDATLYETAPGV